MVYLGLVTIDSSADTFIISKIFLMQQYRVITKVQSNAIQIYILLKEDSNDAGDTNKTDCL